jgi:tetratricopeptide (TPR) repeat protein
MKRIKCELCGSNQIIKQEGIFVCQHCGTKYSAEEAKKMMVDGIVEVTGSVKVDNSNRLTNLYQIARRAKDDNNAENAAKYYDMILIEDPTSWEATFYVVYFKALGCKIFEIQSAAISVNNCLDTVFELIKENVTIETELEKTITEVALRVIDISDMLFNAASNHYFNIDIQIRNNYNQEYINNAFASFNTLYNLGDILEINFADKKYVANIVVNAWKSSISFHNRIINLLADKEGNKKRIALYEDKIKKYDSSYQAPPVPTSGGCYVATAVYGSYNCPQVLILRDYRDKVLAKSWYGRVFIQSYYTISPIIVKWFGKTEWFNCIFRNLLDNFIEKLKNNQ